MRVRTSADPAAGPTLAQIGENALVEMLTRGLPRDARVRVAAGDDCAVIGAPRDTRWQLLKTDAVIEGVHFLPDENPRRIGWKALCRAISDIAAMGGIPHYALITIAVGSGVKIARIRSLYAGLLRAADAFGVSIVGGETARSPGSLFLNIALTGSVERTRCVLRSGGRPGDVLLVTGRLGGSIKAKHLDFTPRLAEARWLVENFKPTAMMDLSDGLAADLPRLAAASRCGFTLDKERIPRTRGIAIERALTDGEDYELLIAVPANRLASLQAAWPQSFPRLPLTQIGSLNSQPSTLIPLRGFDHFT